MSTCTYCRGKGEIACVRWIWDPNEEKQVLCPECKGRGWVTCPRCNGSGREPEK